MCPDEELSAVAVSVPLDDNVPLTRIGVLSSAASNADSVDEAPDRVYVVEDVTITCMVRPFENGPSPQSDNARSNEPSEAKAEVLPTNAM